MDLSPEKWTLLLLSLILWVYFNLIGCNVRNYGFNCMYAVRNLDISDTGCPIKHTWIENFDTQLVFICNTFNYKPKIQRNPRMPTSDFNGLQIYLRPGKVPLSLIYRAKRMFGMVANGTLPGRKYICSPLKSKVIILWFRLMFWFVIRSIAYEE